MKRIQGFLPSVMGAVVMLCMFVAGDVGWAVDYGSHPLGAIAGEAAGMGIPPGVVDNVIVDGEGVVNVNAKEFSGSTTASFSEQSTSYTDHNLNIDADAFADDGQVTSAGMSPGDKAQLIEDVFHESHHYKWLEDGNTDYDTADQDFKDMADQVQQDFADQGVTITQDEALEFIEEGISIKIGKIINVGVNNVETMISTIERLVNQGADPQEIRDRMEKWMKRMEDAMRGMFEGDGRAYVNGRDDVDSGGFDIGDVGRTYIEDEVFGKTIEEMIRRMRLLAEYRAKRIGSGWQHLDPSPPEEDTDEISMGTGWPPTPPQPAPEQAVAAAAPTCSQQVFYGCAAFAAVEVKRTAVRTGSTRGITVKVPSNLGVGTRHARRSVRGGGMRCGR
ncbi:MAG: hypothetical protein ACYTGH_11805 [Planctomycetota bacterium]|jgi:hypothetical protein